MQTDLTEIKELLNLLSYLAAKERYETKGDFDDIGIEIEQAKQKLTEVEQKLREVEIDKTDTDLEHLEYIENFEYHDRTSLKVLMNYIEEHWNHGFGSFVEMHDCYELHTGGWSENESLADALMSNQIMCLLHWKKSERGGHYYFELEP